MDYRKIGQRIRNYRKSRQLSQEELAEQVGISVTHMSHIETGNTKLSLPVFVKIAEALYIQTDELLHDVPPLTRPTLNDVVRKLFNSCSIYEAYCLTEILKSAKAVLDKYYD